TPGQLAVAPEPEDHPASRRSSPRPRPPDGTTAASASTSGSAPRSYPRRTPRRRQAIAHWPGYYTTGLSRASNGASHLNSCTLTPHPPVCTPDSHPRVLPRLGDLAAQRGRAAGDPDGPQLAAVLGHPDDHAAPPVQVDPDDLPAVVCFRHRGPPLPGGDGCLPTS